MTNIESNEITLILERWNRGDEGAEEQLLRIVYDELRRQAHFLMSKERFNHTLQPTALVHEAFIRISSQSSVEWTDRKHFFSIASRLMRQILVDHARGRSAAKRGNNSFHFSIEDVPVPAGARAASVIMIDTALDRLAKLDERQAKIVEMRWFGGFSSEDIADALDISKRTVGREWRSAKLWLKRELSSN